MLGRGAEMADDRRRATSAQAVNDDPKPQLRVVIVDGPAGVGKMMRDQT
jgi:hypothetical protein